MAGEVEIHNRGLALAAEIEYLFDPYTVVNQERQALEAAARFRAGEPQPQRFKAQELISDGAGCTNRANRSDRDYGAERLVELADAKRAGWE